VHWVLSDGWTFASGDYAFLLEVAGVHDTPEFVVAVLVSLLAVEYLRSGS